VTWNEAFERVRARLADRRAAYRAVFKTNDGKVNTWGDVVLKDLARYCYAGKPTLKISQVTQQSDALAMAFAEGRRDVFNRIVAMCNLTSDQIERIAHARTSDE
jgi:hypothetical protein